MGDKIDGGGPPAHTPALPTKRRCDPSGECMSSGGMDILPDGSLVAIQRADGEGETPQIDITLNLVDELKRKEREARH